jgi:hypothetical protein
MCVRDSDSFVEKIAPFFPTDWVITRVNADDKGLGGEVSFTDPFGFWECRVEIANRSQRDIIALAVEALWNDFYSMRKER